MITNIGRIDLLPANTCVHMDSPCPNCPAVQSALPELLTTQAHLHHPVSTTTLDAQFTRLRRTVLVHREVER